MFSSSVWTGGFCLSFVILLLISVVLGSNIGILQMHTYILISHSGVRSSIYNWALLSCDKTMKRLIHSLNTRSLDPCPMCMALFSFSHQPVSTGDVITSGHSVLASFGATNSGFWFNMINMACVPDIHTYPVVGEIDCLSLFLESERRKHWLKSTVANFCFGQTNLFLFEVFRCNFISHCDI